MRHAVAFHQDMAEVLAVATTCDCGCGCMAKGILLTNLEKRSYILFYIGTRGADKY